MGVLQKNHNKIKDKKGFTLAELLIVVAIIAVLAAIAIPIFTSQLEKSREAVDLANLRAAYAECSAALLSRGDPGNGVDFNNNKGVITCNKYVTLKQKQNNWQSGAPEIGGVKLKKTINSSKPVLVAVTESPEKPSPNFFQGTNSLREDQ